MMVYEVNVTLIFMVKSEGAAKEVCHGLKEVVKRYRVDDTICIFDTQIKEMVKEIK